MGAAADPTGVDGGGHDPAGAGLVEVQGGGDVGDRRWSAGLLGGLDGVEHLIGRRGHGTGDGPSGLASPDDDQRSFDCLQRLVHPCQATTCHLTCTCRETSNCCVDDNDRPIGWWLKRLDRLIEASFDDALGEAGIDRRQWQILNVVTRGVIRDAELAKALSPFAGDTPAALGPVVRDLQARGWLSRDDSGALLLTPIGASARDEASSGVSAIRRRLSQGITAEEYQRTVDTLRTMTANMEAGSDA